MPCCVGSLFMGAWRGFVFILPLFHSVVFTWFRSCGELLGPRLDGGELLDATKGGQEYTLIQPDYFNLYPCWFLLLSARSPLFPLSPLGNLG